MGSPTALKKDSLSSRGPRALGALAAAIVLLLVPVPAAGPTPLESFVAVAEAAGEGAQGAATNTPSAADTYTPPRTADGQPDLQGVWANNNATPLERPKSLAGRQFLTDEEVARLKERAGELFAGDGDAAFGDSIFEAVLSDVKAYKPTTFDADTGNYNAFWLVDRDFDKRTSLIVDPPDGRLPPLTEEAQKRRAGYGLLGRNRIPVGPEDRGLSERCITFGVPDLLAGYNSYYQILQTPGYVVIAMERIHDARIIPLDGRPHVPQAIRQWHGDSRGRWDGNTLVVETTNFSPKTSFRESAENLHLVERFTRVAPDTLLYEFTVNDPTTWTGPWTAMIPLRTTTDKIYEYACHEGNTGMVGILAGARAQEAAAEAGKDRR